MLVYKIKTIKIELLHDTYANFIDDIQINRLANAIYKK